MKLKKIFIILITTVMICLLMLGQSLSTAASGILHVGISKLNSEGVGYAIELPGNQEIGNHIWNLTEYESKDVNSVAKNGTTLYCIKGGFGESWNNNSNDPWSNRVTYTEYYNMASAKDKETLVGKENSTGVLNNTQGTPDYSSNSIKENYNQILWILDNLYIPALNTATEQEKENALEQKIALLEAAGIKKKLNNITGEERHFVYEGDSDIAEIGQNLGYILRDGGNDPVLENNKFIDVILTDSDIEAIQQAAIWYYTNNEDAEYTKLMNSKGWEFYYTEDGNTYIQLSDYDKTNGNEGAIRNEQANILYRYLIESANDNKDKYTLTEGVNKLGKPITIDTQKKVELQTIKINNEDKLLFGPINILKNSDFPYSIDLKITDQEDNNIDEANYYFSNEIGQQLKDEKTKIKVLDIKELVGKNDFYIVINANNGENKIETINAKISTSYQTTDKKVWLEDTKKEQPIVEVKKINNPDEIILTGQVKEFDLALRKTIEGLFDNNNIKAIVNKNKEFATRTVDIDKSSLESGTTATYKHRKDPVVVKTGDIVTYKIRIYNEGEQAGFATKIVDQLPSGLSWYAKDEKGNKIETITSTKGNIYEISYRLQNPYDETYNQVILEMTDESKENPKTLAAYNGQDLDYDEIILKCQVTETASDENDKILTNIAYIAEEYNSETGETIIKKGLDRDSAPENNPINNNSLNANKLTTSDIGYTGKKDYEENELKNEEAYYEGEQDDDDFEKIVLLQVEKTTVSGEKVWVDDNNKLQVRPDKVKIGLYIVNADKTETFVKSVEVTSENNWKYSFTKLDKYDVDGNEIKYVVKELDENNNPRENGTIFSSGKGGKYEVSYDSTYNITNTYLPFDLALFKYIAAISEDAKIEDGEYVTDNKNVDGTYLRAPVVTNINSDGTITYKEHDKSPLIVENGDYVLYRIRIYNEGQIDGYASEIKDHLPEGLEFVNPGPETELTDAEREYATNVNWIWEYESSTSIIVTDNLAKGMGAEYGTQEGDANYRANLLRALNPNGEISNENPDWLEVEVLCKVTAPNSSKSILVNVAEISDDTDEDGDEITDIDSIPDNKEKDKDLEEDDIDIEKIKLQCFDLALRKYIYSVNGEVLTGETSRIPVVDVSKLYKKDENGNTITTTATYKHPKTPVTVSLGDTVVYSIRVYNEGDVDGFASEITDHLPPYLEFVEDSRINEKYGWEVSEDGRTVTTRYLSANIYELIGFNKNPKIQDTTLDYEEIQIECKIKETAKTHENITNIAEISEYKYNDNVVNKDADSESDSLTDDDKKDFLPEDKDLPTYKENEKGEYIPGQEDDDDFEKVYIKEFDLALRKFITAVSKDKDIDAKEYLMNGEKYSREPKVDTSKLNKIDEKTGKVVTTAKYEHSKEPVKVSNGEYVEYTIRVYNEGEVAGYAKSISDYIFKNEGLEYAPESNVNKQYKWEMYDKDGKVTEDVTKAVKVETNYLSKENETSSNKNVINAYEEGKTLDYKDVKIVFKVVEPNSSDKILANIAEIIEDSNEQGKDTIDRDSVPGSDEKNYPNGEDKYASEEHEDDIDYDVVILKEFDLALRKFITAVKDEKVTSRMPQVEYKDGKITYTHPKDALEVIIGNTVEYTIRVYNEGEVAGYASEVTDDIPEYLEYLPKHDINKEYGWEMYDKDGKITEKVEEAVKIKTTYLSKESGEERLKENSDKENDVNPNLLNAFDPNKEIDDTNPSYKDVKVAFKVKDPGSSENIITNYAQISDDEDENGNDVPDKDSTPDEWKDGEDDQDIENIKVQYFDLALLKYVSKVIITENGKETITETGYTGYENPEPVVKVELDRKKLSKITVKYVYSIKITNEGDIAGYATEITDYVPEGLKFYAEDNKDWTDEGNNVISTKALKDTLLQPGESATVQVTLRWINDKNNLGLKINTAEISEDDNDKDVPDRDSTPDNKKEKEDDIDTAQVILAIKTGKGTTYIMLVLAVLTTLGGGIALIKKFVL